MGKRTKNWLMWGLVISLFILGAPLVQYVAAGVNASEERLQNAPSVMPQAGHEGQHDLAIKMGDQYLRIVPTGEQSFGLQLYDSNLKLLAVNDNETTLTFTLPDGEKRIVKITVPVKGCSMEEHSSGGSDCCAPGAKAMNHENCEHEQKPVQK